MEESSFLEDVKKELFKNHFSISCVSNRVTKSLKYIISSLQNQQNPNVWILV